MDCNNINAEALNYKAAIVILCFLIIMYFTMRPLCLKVKKFEIWIDYSTSCITCFILLVATLSVGQKELYSAIVGDGHISPYQVIILFFALAYVCISLDLTNVFTDIANFTAKKSVLLFNFYILNSILTAFTSNDIVILTMTPIILQYCNVKKFQRLTFLLSEFIAANTWSMLLFVGNPTNIIIGTAFNISVADYTKYMGLPTVAGSLAIIGLFYLTHKNKLVMDPQDLKTEGDPIIAISMTELGDAISVESSQEDLVQIESTVRRNSAIIGILILLVCLILLAVLQPYVPLYLITIAAAFVVLVKDLCFDYYRHRKYGMLEKNIVLETLKAMPWKVAPFVIIMFILVEALNSSGLVFKLSQGTMYLLQRKSIVETCIIMTLLSAVACTILNNQPMSILFSKILLSPSVACVLPQNQLLASAFATIIGSNLGALLTVNASLAGLLMESVTKGKKVPDFTFWNFTKSGFVSCIPGIIISALFLAFMISTL